MFCVILRATGGVGDGIYTTLACLIPSVLQDASSAVLDSCFFARRRHKLASALAKVYLLSLTVRKNWDIVHDASKVLNLDLTQLLGNKDS